MAPSTPPRSPSATTGTDPPPGLRPRGCSRAGPRAASVDPGESPLDAVLREVHEETAHHLVAPQLVHVDSWRFTGMAPSGRLEDFHGIGIVYTADVEQVREPRVLDVGGSTSAAAWVSLADLPELNLGRRGPWLLQVLGLRPTAEA